MKIENWLSQIALRRGISLTTNYYIIFLFFEGPSLPTQPDSEGANYEEVIKYETVLDHYTPLQVSNEPGYENIYEQLTET